MTSALVVTFLLASTPPDPSEACAIVNQENGRTVGYIEVRDTQTVLGMGIKTAPGRAVSNKDNEVIGRVEGNDVRNVEMRKIGRLEGMNILTASGRTIGHVKGSDIFNNDGRKVGHVKEGCSTDKAGAALLLGLLLPW